MLTLVMNTMTGLIAATVLASLLHSARSFWPTYSRLRAEVSQAECQQGLRVTFREMGETLPQPLARCPGIPAEAVRPQRITSLALTGRSAVA